MKLFVEVSGPEVSGPGIENLASDPILQRAVAAVVRSLVKSYAGGPQPKVEAHLVDDDAVLVTATALFKLNEKASALRRIVECEDRDIFDALTQAKELLK